VTSILGSRPSVTLTQESKRSLPRLTGLSLVVPMLNEEKNVDDLVRSVESVLTALALEWELILVDDGSSDETGSRIREAMSRDSRVRHVSHPIRRGYGAALRSGMSAARHPFVALMDGDLQIDSSDLLRFRSGIESHDLVLGYRSRRRDGWTRGFAGSVWNHLAGRLLGFRVKDVDCSLKMFRRAILEALPLRSRGAAISAELVARARARGARITEVEVNHKPRRHGVQTGLQPRVVLRALAELATLWAELSRHRSARTAAR
jgi:glycosyltransferase involved in cell wall biosynthesis